MQPNHSEVPGTSLLANPTPSTPVNPKKHILRQRRENPTETPLSGTFTPRKDKGKGKALPIDLVSNDHVLDSSNAKHKIKFDQGDDFIPFRESHSPSVTDEVSQRNTGRNGKAGSPPVQDWDREKSNLKQPDSMEMSGSKGSARDRDRSPDGPGSKHNRKRKHGSEISSSYESKKQRVDIPSRKAPWVAHMNWEHCNNVAEMYVSQFD
jgi:hypothetical protein